MKKLLVTSALAGLVISGSAFAQTTITGELRINYGAAGTDQATANTKARRGFGAEQQINVQTKGKLNIGGLDYAAGFAIENDGEQSTTIFNENTYMDFTNPGTKTTISFSRDHIQRSDTDRSAAVFLGYSPNDISSQSAYSAGTSLTRFQQSPGPQVGQAFSVAILQATDIGTFSAAYTPSAIENSGLRTTATTTIVNNNSERPGESDAESAYEIGFVGGLGVKGLSTYAFYGKEKHRPGAATDAFVKNYGIAYTLNEFSVGYTYKNYADSDLTSTKENKENHYGLAYAVNKDVTVALLKAVGKGVGDTGGDEIAKSIQVGYNLGPVGMVAGYATYDNVANTANNDGKAVFVRLIGAF